MENAEIVKIDGLTSAAVPGLGMTVHSSEEGSLFKRRAIRTTGASECWLVGELDGVRCYVTRKAGQVHVVLSCNDLYPDP